MLPSDQYELHVEKGHHEEGGGWQVCQYHPGDDNVLPRMLRILHEQARQDQEGPGYQTDPVHMEALSRMQVDFIDLQTAPDLHQVWIFILHSAANILKKLAKLEDAIGISNLKLSPTHCWQG